MGYIIAALDLGSSKSIAFVAHKNFSNKLTEVLHTETLPSKGAIRRGRIHSTEMASEIVSKLIKNMKNNPAIQIDKIYVGIGGQSLRTQSLKITRNVEDGTITLSLIDSLKKEAQNYQPEVEENFGVYSSEYFADGSFVPISNLRGTRAKIIEAQYQLIVGNPCEKSYLETVLSKTGISVAGYIISPIATAEAVLTREEKESGCALVEWGEGVTYVSVYKNKELRYLATIPLGGLAITNDIKSLNVYMEEAEILKIKYGSVCPESNDSRLVPVDEEQDSSRKIDLLDLNWIIEARVNEIAKNVWNQICLSGYSEKIDAGIVITGGGALLRDLPQFLKNMTEKEVRLAKAKVINNNSETELSPAESCVAGLAMFGKDNCGKLNISKIEKVENPLFQGEEIEEKKNKQLEEEKIKEEKKIREEKLKEEKKIREEKLKEEKKIREEKMREEKRRREENKKSEYVIPFSFFNSFKDIKKKIEKTIDDGASMLSYDDQQNDNMNKLEKNDESINENINESVNDISNDNNTQ